MDPGPCPGFSLKDVKWSAVAVPLDLLVSTYRLPQLARLDSGVWGAGVGSGHRERELAPRWPGGSSGGQRCPAAAVLQGGCCRGAADPAPREAVKQQGRREEPPGTFCRRCCGCPPAVPKSACVSLAAPGRKAAARVLALGSSPAGGLGGSPQKLRRPLGDITAWRLPETAPALPSVRES